jgi:hypothetical protein
MRIDGQPCARAFLSMPVCLPTFNRASAAPSGRRPAPPRTRLAGPSPGLGRQRKARIRNGVPRPARQGKKKTRKKDTPAPARLPPKKNSPSLSKSGSTASAASANSAVDMSPGFLARRSYVSARAGRRRGVDIAARVLCRAVRAASFCSFSPRQKKRGCVLSGEVGGASSRTAEEHHRRAQTRERRRETLSPLNVTPSSSPLPPRPQLRSVTGASPGSRRPSTGSVFLGAAAEGGNANAADVAAPHALPRRGDGRGQGGRQGGGPGVFEGAV